MNKEYIWRFPTNNFDVEKGLDTADMETFKRDPISSLAREICQNSIDARRDINLPVKIEFSLFTVDANTIPGIGSLKQEIDSCLKYWSHSETIKSQLESMATSISKNKITCLRISDFNTTGLVGVSDSLSNDKPWYLLTKGSGISLKEGTTGGSKGIGKFSTFVASSFNTVFYSTVTKDGEIGYQGIAKFASTNSRNNPEEKTSGNGYFSSNGKNQPILENFVLDKNFIRTIDEFGTDVYILGFEYNNWESLVISKVLESFMVAIVRNNLEVIVNKKEINALTLDDLIRNRLYIRPKDYKSINAQYELLTSKKIFNNTFQFEHYGEFELMIKGYSHQEVSNAVNKCLMVRFPYMKIKSFDNLTHIPHSAMCIIGDNLLNQILRKIENPQHTDWEINRIKDPDQKKLTDKIIKDLKKFISEQIRNYLLESDHKESDIEGASDYLPDTDKGQNTSDEEVFSTHTTKLKENIVNSPIGLQESETEQGLEPELGDTDTDGEDKHFGEKEKGNGTKEEPVIEGESETGSNTIFKLTKLEGIKHKFFVYDKEKGLYALNVVSPIDEEKCMISIFALDDMNKRKNINFLDVETSSQHELINGNIHIELIKEAKYNFKFKTNTNEKFAAEVVFYAIR
jgi:hypothetical protein